MGGDIRVRVIRRQVTLTGIADDYAAKRDISMVVKDIGGVSKVSNRIRVSSVS